MTKREIRREARKVCRRDSDVLEVLREKANRLEQIFYRGDTFYTAKVYNELKKGRYKITVV